MKFYLKNISVWLCCIFLLSPAFVFAQAPSSIDGITIDMYPASPAPGETVEINLESYSTDLNGAAIIWLVDNKELARGTGKLKVEIKAPPLGKTTTVQAAIKTVEGREVKKAILVTSGGVDLVWESMGYTPPLFKGKALFAYENTVKVSAIPHLAGANGEEIDPKTLIYKWSENDKVILDQSGYGKQTLTLQVDLPRPLVVKVEVLTSTGTSKATREINLTPGEPAISFYEESPLYGVLYNKSLMNSVRLTNQEINIRAVPFAFNISKERPLVYTWSINNLERPDLSTQESLILRTKGDVAGSSNISLDIRNQNDILQGARGALNVEFTKKTESIKSPF